MIEDGDDDAAALVAVWYAGSRELCAEAPVAEDGSTTCTVELEAGEAEIALEVLDPVEAAGATSVALDVRANAAPAVQIVSPLDGAALEAGLIVVEALVADSDGPAEALTLAWTDGAGDPVDLPLTPDSDGSLIGAITLPAGSHALTLTATDTSGATGEATVGIEAAEQE